MKTLNKLLIFKIITVFILSVIASYFLTFFYKLDRSYLLIFIFTFASFMLFILNFIFRKLKVLNLILKSIIIALYFVAAVYIFLKIIIIPYPFYQAWLIFIQNKLSGGIISYIFIFLLSYFISFFSGLIFYFGFTRPLSAIILTFSIMFSISFQNRESSAYFLIIIMISVVLCLLSLTIFPYRKNFLPFYSSIKILIVTLILSGILFLLTYSKSGWLSEYSLNSNFKNLIKSVIPDLPFLPEIDGHGNFFESKSLGGKLVLHRQPVFEIKAKPKDKLYLRTKVYQKYTGYGWERDIRLKKDALNYLSLKNGSLNANIINIKLLADYYSFIPHTLDTESIKIEGYDSVDFTYADFDTGFELKLPVIKGAEFILGTKIGKSEKIIDAAVYLNIPLLLRKKIENSEFNFKNDLNENDILNKIKSYLTGNYKYSIYSKALGLDEDFVENFLFNDKKGYCEHFASSMAVLARFYNIPSRFVTGYLVFMPSYIDSTVCTGMMAHAWAEIYLKEKGWTVWEATPPMDFFSINTNNFDNLKNIYDKNTLKQIKEMFKYNINIYSDKRAFNLEFFTRFLLFIFSVISIGITFILVFNLYKKNKLKIGHAHHGPELKKIKPYIKKLLRITGEKNKLNSPDKTGWLKWAEDYKKFSPQISKKIDCMTDIIIRSLYSKNKEIDKKRIRFLKLFLKKIKKFNFF